MKNSIILLLTVFILSCATPPQILDDGFISSQPNFQVQFHKPIIEKSVKSQRIQHGDVKIYHFLVNNTEAISIQTLTYIPSRSGIYFYGPEQFLTNIGCMVLDPVVIDGRRWIKFVNVLNNNFLFTGYFRIMDKSYISVGRICNADAYAEEIGSFRKGTSLKSGQWKLWDEAFAHTDQLFSIGMVAPAEPESAHPDLSPVQKKSFKKYLDNVKHPHLKAFAIEINSDRSGWGYGYYKPEHAIKASINWCESIGVKCQLYAVGDRIVKDYSKDHLSIYLSEYYEEIYPPGKLRDIVQQALRGDEIKTLITGREGEGEDSRTGNKYTLKFMASERFIFGLLKTDTSWRTGNYWGDWWIEGDLYCRKYDKDPDRTECFYVINEGNGIAWYDLNGAFIARIRFTTPLSSE